MSDYSKVFKTWHFMSYWATLSRYILEAKPEVLRSNG